MKNPLRLAVLLLPLAGACAAPQKKAVEAAAPVDDPMMSKMMEYATPGPAHEVLQAKVGKWKAQLKAYMEPGKEPVVSSGTSEVKPIFGGRYFEDTFTGSFMDAPFHGRGLTGYDNLKKKYVAAWADDMSTGIMHSEGTYDPATKTFTFVGEAPDPMAGKFVKTRMVEKTLDPDHFTVQMYMPGPDGMESLSMEIQYTRAR